MTHRRKALGLLVSAVALLAMTGTASAGRVVLTGHDMDFHCNGNGSPNPANQCHYIKTALDFVRDPLVNPHTGNPVLVIDKRPGSLSNPSGNFDEVQNALKYAYPSGVPGTVLADPADPNFAAEISPLSAGGFSAVIIASDSTCGGCDLNDSSTTPDSDIINRVAAGPIQAAFSSGTGIIAFAGANHGDGSNPAMNNYYSFLPPAVLATGLAVSPPFTLTNLGRTLGICDPKNKPSPSAGCAGLPAGVDDINCCPTHNSFAEPAKASTLAVVERDSAGKAETLFGDVTKCGDTLCTAYHPATLSPPAAGLSMPNTVGPDDPITETVPRIVPPYGDVIEGAETVSNGGAVIASTSKKKKKKKKGKKKPKTQFKKVTLNPGSTFRFKPKKFAFLRGARRVTVCVSLVTNLSFKTRTCKSAKLKKGKKKKKKGKKKKK